MTPATPSPGRASNQRALAAIVFTDVVSFSARMQADELGTLELLQRDFAEMRRICTAHEGAVLKTTGDGLLLTFTSAVQAVACALAMQRQFAAEAKNHAAGGALQHRIGIHLGDVLVQDQDVMGDGVNIASRLQAEAEPGGICISQTVYDVVKNKLEMNVVSLGERELKNISEAMPVYQLLLEAQALDAKGNPQRAVPARSAFTGRRLLWLGGAAVLVAVILAVAYFRQRDAARTEAQSPLAPEVVKEKTDLADTLATGFNKRRDAMQQLHERYLDKYDFNGLVLALRDKAEAPAAAPGLKQMLRNAEQLAALKEWLDLDLRRYSQSHPLTVQELSNEKPPRLVAVYMTADGRVAFLDKGTPQPHDWPALTPVVVGAIIVSAVHEASRAPHSIHAGAQVFARFYTLPLMTEALGHASR